MIGLAKFKNALTEHYVGAIVADIAETVWLRLAKGISSVTDDTDEEVEEQAWYDGDGTKEKDLVSKTFTYNFEGEFDGVDEAMSFIAGLEFKLGDDVKVNYKQVRKDGKTLIGPATASGIKTIGGDAAEFQPFEVAISWDEIPTITP